MQHSKHNINHTTNSAQSNHPEEPLVFEVQNALPRGTSFLSLNPVGLSQPAQCREFEWMTVMNEISFQPVIRLFPQISMSFGLNL